MGDAILSSTRAPAIIGLAGCSLSDGERAMLRTDRPAGIILFARNCTDPAQVAALVSDALAEIGEQALVLIDQEGGRVQRLGPPHWRKLPAAAAYAALYEQDPDVATAAAKLVARLTAADLAELGINMNCAPVGDVPVEGAHDIIGDRAYGRTAGQIGCLARATAQGLMEGGVLPVAKHIPGHGRARGDSHLELPIVTASRRELEATDFAAFRALADLPAAMTAHIVFTDIDPTAPATQSTVVIEEIIRSSIGFHGLLMSDDIGMKALKGAMSERATSTLAAGCDIVLHCSGDEREAGEVLAALPPLAGVAARRLDQALALAGRQTPFDRARAEALLSGTISGISRAV